MFRSFSRWFRFYVFFSNDKIHMTEKQGKYFFLAQKEIIPHRFYADAPTKTTRKF